ncbi:alpha/beta hydrolase [Streptomyces durbertensis]|uniref:Alpha/beta hydrolase n=2 Tax=Streptomyces durbertensis TaxID=2448886 RepID=A0ABR6EL13_9ACTN|nr:alpha/beta fold hydrolase [Streptomyces durbertensis]MBB1246018.1 alpha/beta hydrolase [Streptomyces durbertensis]
MAEELMQAADGTPLATYSWRPRGGTPRALVLVAHGAAEHARRYEDFARHLTAHGYAVVACDHRGHGGTARYTGGLGAAGEDAWRWIVRDLHTVGERARAEFSGVPLVLMGHSMGAQLARDYAQEYGEELAGLILTGTFRSLPGCETESVVRSLSAEIEKVGRNAPSGFVTDLFGSLGAAFERRTGFEWLSRDPAQVDRYVADEWCGFPFGAGLSLDWVLGSRKINDPDHFHRIPRTLPVHIAVGDQDPCHQRMTLVYELLEDFRHLGTRDLSWRAYPQARHEILNETNRAEVHADLLRWLDQRLG